MDMARAPVVAHLTQAARGDAGQPAGRGAAGHFGWAMFGGRLVTPTGERVLPACLPPPPQARRPVRRNHRCRQSVRDVGSRAPPRSEEHTSELQSLMRISYAVFCLKKKNRYKTVLHPAK